MPSPTPLNREQFKQAVFARDKVCVNCGATPQDAHHIIERRLWGASENYGYFIDNGAALCGACHLLAESTVLSCAVIREKAGIGVVALPEHLYRDQEYDKWANPILANGRRIPGELFYDESVQKILFPVLHLFDKRVKYPRTYHLPWSPGGTKDDRILPSATLDSWVGTEVVITEKRDGENTTLYNDTLHTRSLDYEKHLSRSRVKALHSAICGSIPEGFRICGENLTAEHSIHYSGLKSFFEVFSVWENLTCLSWDETVEYAALLDLVVVPVLWRGIWREEFINPEILHKEIKFQSAPTIEGYVVRSADSFSYGQFRSKVGKYVRSGHVQTHGNWMRQAVRFNEFEQMVLRAK